MIGLIWSLIQNIGMGFYNLAYAITHPSSWLSWVWNGLAAQEDKEAMMRFVYYGGSKELFFVIFDLLVLLTVLGLWRKPIMYRSMRIFEGIGNKVGRFAAWAGLLMVLQQIMIVFLQRIFLVADISIGPFAPFGYPLIDGIAYTKNLGWWAEELKLYNAMIVTLCAGYTFIQGGHVRVDLFYAGMSYSKKRITDMLGSVFFILPVMTMVWLYAWYFMWRHLVTPKVSASDSLDLLLRKARILKWNVETIGFSLDGFNAYFLFKVLLVAFAALMVVQAMAFFFRSVLEYRDGPEAEGAFLDKDTLGEGEEAFEGTH